MVFEVNNVNTGSYSLNFIPETTTGIPPRKM